MWRKLDRLYLLSADPSSNLLRLGIITECLENTDERLRVPLIVRIDDPWQAEAWRAKHFGGSDTRWAADAVGKYEVTARRLLDRIIGSGSVRRILVCGASRLTLALCSELGQRQLEKAYYCAPGDPPLPQLVLVAENADEYEEDYEHSQRQLGLADEGLRIEAVPEPPTVSVLSTLLKSQGSAGETAVILVDADGTTGSAVDTTTGTRLAARFPTTPIYAWDPDAEVDRGSAVDSRPVEHLPPQHGYAAWPGAGRLGAGGPADPRPLCRGGRPQVGGKRAVGKPRRVLPRVKPSPGEQRLWMVEKIGGHTWNVWDGQGAVPIANMRGREPLEQLQLMGFERDAAIKMAREEHEDWCRYYKGAGWRYGTPRDDARKIHDKLDDWQAIEADPERFDRALSSLATTLIRLRELGYRSRPVPDE